MSTDNFTLTVTRADGGVSRIGPIGFHHVAERMVWAFESMASNTTGADGASYSIDSYTPKPDETYLPLVGCDTYSILELMDDPVQGTNDVPFPDLWSRLHAQHGYEAAERAWKTACWLMDAPEDVEA